MKKEERTGVSTAAATPQPYRAKPISAFDACSTAIPYKKWKGVFYYLAEDVERERADALAELNKWKKAENICAIALEKEQCASAEAEEADWKGRAVKAEKKLAELQKLLEYNVHFKEKAEARVRELEGFIAWVLEREDWQKQFKYWKGLRKT